MRTQVTITVDDAHLGEIGTVARQLTSAGLHVDQVLSTIGMIIGSVAPSRRTRLSRVPGVASVEEERSMVTAPPESEVQ